MNYKFLSVDFQNDFAHPKGKWFNGGKSIKFVNTKLIPFLKQNQLKVSEIISDYRAPRLKGFGIGCIPGEFGFESILPDEVKEKPIWVKCMNSPTWIRKNCGIKNKKPSFPFQDTKSFDKWLIKQFGKPTEDLTIILFGLTLDCCVLATAQELRFRGYNFKILIEATDVMPNKNQDEIKKQIVYGEVLNHWLNFIAFDEVKKIFETKE